MSNTPQEWLSELEVDERRKLVFDSMVREYGEAWNNDRARQKLVEVTAVLLSKPWFQSLPLQEVDDLSTTEGWNWHRCVHFEEAVAFNVRDLVEDELVHALSYMVEEGAELLDRDIRRGTDHVQARIAFLRTLASRYGFTMSYLFKRLRELTEADR